MVYDFCTNIQGNTWEGQMRREEAAGRARLLPSTAALVSSVEVKFLDDNFEEKSPFSAVGLWLQRERLGLCLRWLL